MKFIKMRVLYVVLMVKCTLTVAGQQAPGSILWKYDASFWINSSPALGSRGEVIISALAAGLQAVTNSPSGASNKWTLNIGVLGSEAVSSDGTVFLVGGPSSSLYAVNPDGTIKWQFNTGGAGGTPAIGVDGTIYLQAYTGVYAVTQSGSLKWKSGIGDSAVFSSPVIGPDGTVYVGSSEFSKLCAIAEDGTQKWLVSLTSSPADSAAVSGAGFLYCAGGPLYAFRQDGTAVWAASSSLRGSPSIGVGGVVYASAALDHHLEALNPEGAVLWLGPNQGSYQAPTTAAVDRGGNVYYCVANTIWALSPSGSIQWKIVSEDSPPPGTDLASTSPIIGPDGTLYATLGSKLYAIASGTNGPADSPWPMYRGNAQHTGRIQKPSLQSPKKRADANFEFQLFSQTGTSVSVESSTNLTTWNTLTSVIPTTAPEPIVDLTASNSPAKFYRAKGGG